MNYKPRTFRWFKNRIGKRIFRDKSTCDCAHCRAVEKEGLIVFDKQHAQHLADIDADFATCGAYLNYRDKL